MYFSNLPGPDDWVLLVRADSSIARPLDQLRKEAVVEKVRTKSLQAPA